MRFSIFLCLFTALSLQAQHRLLVSGCGYGEVAVYAADGTKEWSMPEKREVSDAWLLPNGDIAMSYKFGAQIIRPDWSNGSGFEIIHNRPTQKSGENHTCMPLKSGGYLLGESFDGISYVIELDAEFRETKRITLKGLGGKHSTFRQISKTPQGTYLITQQKKNGIAMEVDASGAVIRRFPDGKFTAMRLDNGNTLIACGDAHRIIEVDHNDQVVWSLERNDLEGIQLGFIAGLQRLPNGNTLLANWGGHGGTSGASIIEVSPDKQVIWTTSPGKANRVSNIKVLP